MTLKIRAVAASAVVVAAIVAGIIVLGAPTVQRQRRLDERRVFDLTTIESAITVHWHRHGALPANLAALSAEPGLHPNTRDPTTGVSYEYEIVAPDAYRLCAVFAFDSAADPVERAMASSWSHGAGRHCFPLRVPQDD